MALTAAAVRTLSLFVQHLESLSIDEAKSVVSALLDTPFSPSTRSSNSTSNHGSNHTSKQVQTKVQNGFEQETDSDLRFFLQFWEQYPRRQDKQESLRLYRKLKPDQELQAKILEALLRDKASEQWVESRFIPLPSTWLNRRRWEDEPQAQTKRESLSQRLWREAQDEKRTQA